MQPARRSSIRHGRPIRSHSSSASAPQVAGSAAGLPNASHRPVAAHAAALPAALARRTAARGRSTVPVQEDYDDTAPLRGSKRASLTLTEPCSTLRRLREAARMSWETYGPADHAWRTSSCNTRGCAQRRGVMPISGRSPAMLGLRARTLGIERAGLRDG